MEMYGYIPVQYWGVGLHKNKQTEGWCERGYNWNTVKKKCNLWSKQLLLNNKCLTKIRYVGNALWLEVNCRLCNTLMCLSRSNIDWIDHLLSTKAILIVLLLMNVVTVVVLWVQCSCYWERWHAVAAGNIDLAWCLVHIWNTPDGCGRITILNIYYDPSFKQWKIF